MDFIIVQLLLNDFCIFYFDNKNKNDNPNLHSRSIFAITVNEICQKNRFSEDEY